MTVQTIITADESGEELVTYARQVAQTLVRNGLTRAQIRNIFTEVRQIESMWNNESRKKDALLRLNMLKPKLAYQKARTGSVEHLEKVLCEAIEAVGKSTDQDAAFQRFMNFFEAILAYHRAEGGRN